MTRSAGFAHLVGAGPGDPGLLTVAGRRALERAEVVVYDRLGTEALMPLCRPGALLLNAGKAPGRQAMTQEQINACLVEHVAAGKRVVRLKGGDPFVFGRGGEEAEALAREGLAYEVIPGITSAIAAPAYAGIPVTHRGLATSFTVVTGHEDPTKPSEQTDWAALAAVPGTLIILMGMGRLAAISERLIAGGRPAGQPAAAVQWGTTPRQRRVVSTLGELPGAVAEAGLGSPAVVVVGPVAALAPAIDWIERRPLRGRRVVVTRSRMQASALGDRLRALGAEVVELPTIRIAPLPEDAAAAALLDGVRDRTHLVLTSVNGVDEVFARLAAHGRDARSLSPETTVIAIGPATAGRLAENGVRADLVPERFVAEGILDALPDDLAGASVLVARARGSRPKLVDELRARGALVDELLLYEAVPERATPEALDAALGADHLTFTASSTVTAFMDLLDGAARARLADSGPRVVSIGPITSATARERGLTVHAEAAEHTIPGLVDALLVDVAR
ncbi:MAG: uroporphyrinogen-III C-methyltransferase [Thermoleophilia bacterium]